MVFSSNKASLRIVSAFVGVGVALFSGCWSDDPPPAEPPLQPLVCDVSEDRTWIDSPFDTLSPMVRHRDWLIGVSQSSEALLIGLSTTTGETRDLIVTERLYLGSLLVDFPWFAVAENDEAFWPRPGSLWRGRVGADPRHVEQLFEYPFRARVVGPAATADWVYLAADNELFALRDGQSSPQRIRLPSAPLDLVADETGVYWFDQQGTLSQLELGAELPSMIVEGEVHATLLTSNGGSLYWLSEDLVARRLSHGGGSPSTVATLDMHVGASVTAMIASSGFIYVVEGRDMESSLLRVNLETRAIDTLLESTLSPESARLALDDACVYRLGFGYRASRDQPLPAEGATLTSWLGRAAR